MNITLESRPCPHCGKDNSIHIDQCHNCHKTLPWAGSEATQVLTKAAPADEQRPSKTMSILWQVAGCIVIVIGLFLWIGNVSGVYRTFPGCGFWTMIVGGAILNRGIDKMFNV